MSFDEAESISIDIESSDVDCTQTFHELPGMSDADFSDSVAEFECLSRDKVKGGHWYHVDHSNEHDDLDYIGKIVIINGIARVCEDFSLDDEGLLSLFVKT